MIFLERGQTVGRGGGGFVLIFWCPFGVALKVPGILVYYSANQLEEADAHKKLQGTLKKLSPFYRFL